MTVFDTASLDLNAYLARIGCDGARTPDLETLSAVALHHPLAIPFENLNPLAGRPVALDLPSLQRKLVREGRGGWCFEHNVLLGTVLRALGFAVTGLAARVMWNAPAGSVTPRSHMVLRIDLDGRSYIADAGFGGLTLTAPLRLEAGIEQPTPHETFRLRMADDYYVLESYVAADWRPLYRFDLQPQLLADYEVTSWYLANSPRSHFVTTLVAARVYADRRVGLRNTDLSIHHRDGFTEKRVLAGAAELRHALDQLFGIPVPAGADIDAALSRIAALAPATSA